MDRRDFLALTAAGALPALHARAADPEAAHPRFKAIGFDAFVLFDPRPIAAELDAIFPGKGPALMTAWRTRQFEYQWLRALGGRFADFMQCTEDSLVFVCKQNQLELTTDHRRRLLAGFQALQLWPDAEAALATLHRAGVRLAFVSNMTRAILEAGLKKAGISHLFEALLATEAIKTYKPDPRAYQLAIDHFKLKREEILFAAFGGWDACGAKWFGYTTYWVNRLGTPVEELGAAPDGTSQGIAGQVEFALGKK